MKKAASFLLTSVVMLVALCLLPFSAHAAEKVSVSIPVEIEGGGTAVVISEVNCPLPERSATEVLNGTTEKININFTVPGDYGYTIRAEAKDEAYFSPEYYTALVAVRADSGGELTGTVVLKKADSEYKPDVCLFTRAEETIVPSDDTKPVEPDEPVTPKQGSKNPPVSRPKTGDDSMLDFYLLICIAASGGLFLLSVIYLVSTERMIGRKKQEKQ